MQMTCFYTFQIQQNLIIALWEIFCYKLNFYWLMLLPRRSHSISYYSRSPEVTYSVFFLCGSKFLPLMLLIWKNILSCGQSFLDLAWLFDLTYMLHLAMQGTDDNTSGHVGRSYFALCMFSAFFLPTFLIFHLFPSSSSFFPSFSLSATSFVFPVSSPLHDSIIYYPLRSHSHPLKDPAEFTNGHD